MTTKFTIADIKALAIKAVKAAREERGSKSAASRVYNMYYRAADIDLSTYAIIVGQGGGQDARAKAAEAKGLTVIRISETDLE